MVRRESGFDLLENLPETGARDLGLMRGPFGKGSGDELREFAHARLDWMAFLLACAPESDVYTLPAGWSSGSSSGS